MAHNVLSLYGMNVLDGMYLLVIYHLVIFLSIEIFCKNSDTKFRFPVHACNIENWKELRNNEQHTFIIAFFRSRISFLND